MNVLGLIGSLFGLLLFYKGTYDNSLVNILLKDLPIKKIYLIKVLCRFWPAVPPPGNNVNTVLHKCDRNLDNDPRLWPRKHWKLNSSLKYMAENTNVRIVETFISSFVLRQYCVVSILDKEGTIIVNTSLVTPGALTHQL